METIAVINGTCQKLAFKSHEEVKNLLITLHDYYELSWTQIAALPAFNQPEKPEIPFSTLSKISKTGIVPKKWRSRFPGIGAIDNRPRTMIHKKNMLSTARTLKNHLTPKTRLELLEYLIRDLREELFIMAQGIFDFDQIELNLTGEISYTFICPRCLTRNRGSFEPQKLTQGFITIQCSNYKKCGLNNATFDLNLEIAGRYQDENDIPLNEVKNEISRR